MCLFGGCRGVWWISWCLYSPRWGPVEDRSGLKLTILPPKVDLGIQVQIILVVGNLIFYHIYINYIYYRIIHYSFQDIIPGVVCNNKVLLPRTLNKTFCFRYKIRSNGATHPNWLTTNLIIVHISSSVGHEVWEEKSGIESGSNLATSQSEDLLSNLCKSYI